MKNSTSKKSSKIGKYSAAAGAFLATGAINAQIQYTDVNPDHVIDVNNSPYNLDFNADATNDITLQVVQISTSGSTFNYSGFAADVVPGANGVVGGGSPFVLPLALNAMDPINSSANFLTGGSKNLGALVNYTSISSSVTYTGTISNGNFLGQTDKFLGARFDIGGNTHYGWVRLDVAADGTTITVKDYAYNTIATESIQAGQTVGLENISVENKVSIKTLMNEAYINVTPDLIGGRIVITDLNGKEISSVEVTDINTKIEYTNIQNGVYLLVAQFESGSVSKKIYVK